MSTAISAPGNMTASPQERAAMLINKVDVVLSSNQARRDMLSSIEHQFADSFDASETSLEPSEQGDAFNGHASFPAMKPTTKLTVDRLPKTVDRLLESDSSSRRSLASNSSKKSRFATVSELKAQLQDCHNALLTMRENASLKYRKLELEYVNLTASFALVQSELDQERAKSAQLAKEKLHVQRQLQEAIGTDYAIWITKLEESQYQVGQKLALEKLERAELSEYNAQLQQIMGECGRCQRRMPQKGHYNATRGSANGTPVTPKPVSSLWGSLMSAVKDMDPSLGNEETDVVVAGNANHATFNSSSANLNISPKAQPPPEMFLFQQQSQQMKDDLEADISAMEKEMSDEIVNLKNQWGSTPKVFAGGKNKNKKSSKKRSSSKKKPDAFGSLDDFFGAATAGLEDEEMDEEKSFFSLQRSVSTMPDKRKKKKKRSNKKSDSDDEEMKEEMKEELAAELESEADRRALMTAAVQSKKSFRDRLMGFATESVAEEESFAFKSSRSLRSMDVISLRSTTSLTSEIAASVEKSVRWEADAFDRTEEDVDENEDEILAMEVQAWGEEAHAAVVTI
jgi:hypothetical protein